MIIYHPNNASSLLSLKFGPPVLYFKRGSSIYEVNVSVQESMFYNNKVNSTLILPIEKPISASLLARSTFTYKSLERLVDSVLVLRNWSWFYVCAIVLTERIHFRKVYN